MEETTFENVKIGDRVYCFLGSCAEGKMTNGSIVEIDTKSPYPMIISLDGTKEGAYSCDFKGKYVFSGGQITFWSKPEFKVPVRPKRKRIIEGYVGVSVYEPNISGIIASLTNLYEKPEQVRSIMNIGQPVFVKIEIEE